MKKKKVAIVGAGLSGLIAAKELFKNAFDITVYEKEATPGGRMRTETIDGWELDRGFQVLLTGYPYLKKHLEGLSLESVVLDAGATVFYQKKQFVIGDPARNINLLLPTIFAPAGTLKDKWLILKLRRTLKKKSIAAIFETENRTTADWLKQYGFSDQIITRFFRPFYAGIFLEDRLETSCRMFLFVFKMFAEGEAVIPKGGISKLSEQIATLLDTEGVKFYYDTPVQTIEKGKLTTEKRGTEHYDVIINTEAKFNKSYQEAWKGTHVFYFQHPGEPIIKAPRIGLIPDKNKVINNVFYATPTQSRLHGDQQLLSVTVVNDRGYSIKELQRKVNQEVRQLVNQKIDFVHHEVIDRALPDIESPVNEQKLSITDQVVHIGDYQLNGSQNAACKTGEEVAKLLNDQYT